MGTCELTGRKVMFGSSVSHANNRKRRKFNVNRHAQRFYIPEVKAWVKINLSAAAMRETNRYGIYDTLRRRCTM